MWDTTLWGLLLDRVSSFYKQVENCGKSNQGTEEFPGQLHSWIFRCHTNLGHRKILLTKEILE